MTHHRECQACSPEHFVVVASISDSSVPLNEQLEEKVAHDLQRPRSSLSNDHVVQLLFEHVVIVFCCIKLLYHV